MRRLLLTALAAAASLAVSALGFAWLAISSKHPDRPPIFAIAAFLVALGAAAIGVMLAVRMAQGLRGQRYEGE